MSDYIRGHNDGLILGMSMGLTVVGKGSSDDDPEPTTPNPGSIPIVRHIDFDGTVLQSVPTSEYISPPPVPDHSDRHLVFQKWNRDLANLDVTKSYDVGATYCTDDGKTHAGVYILTANGRITVETMSDDPFSQLSVDWGDGNVGVTNSFSTLNSLTHTYASEGQYTIKFWAFGALSGALDAYNVRRVSSNNGSIAFIHSVHIGQDAGIAATAFNTCSSLSAVTIPDGVVSIGSSAFMGCHSLSAVIIPDSVTIVESGTFTNCYSLSSIVLPNSVASIERGTFSGCYALSPMIIPDSVTSIEPYAFSGCYSFSSVTLPDTVTNIGERAFGLCYSLSSVTIANSDAVIGSAVFMGCYSLSAVTLPDGDLDIGSSAFDMCTSLTSMKVPHGVTLIRTSTFSSCHSLQTVTIPDSVTSIESSAFNACHSLSSITIPDSVTNIGSSAFSGCNSLSYAIVLAKTPPAIASSSVFPSSTIIYVPDESIDAYKSASVWSSLTTRIRTISSKPDF